MATFGYVLPASGGSDVPNPDSLFEIAQEADKGSLEHLWVSDHILWHLSMYDSLALLPAIAARTSRIKIGPAVLQLAMRHPVLVAKTLASIDRLSGGRLTLGVGIGGEFAPEWEAMGVALQHRAKRTDEMLQALRGLWHSGPFSFDGKHVSIESVDLQPKPIEPIPIWVGGRSEGSVRRAAHFGDGWMGIFLDPDRYARRLVELGAQCEQAGRETSQVLPSLYVWTCIADTDSEARERASILGAFYNLPFEKLERFAIFGSAETCARRFKEFEDAGVRHFAAAPIEPEVTPDQLIRLTALTE